MLPPGAAYAMDADRSIGDTIEFDSAVAARRLADEAGETLVFVLADHECSGFSLIGVLTGGMIYREGDVI